MKKSYEELQILLTNASEQIKLGSYWTHYKNPNKKYEIKDLVIIEETEKVGIVYESEDNPGIKFLRPFEEFFEDVEFEEKIIKRFRPLS
ncbi:DUF1653 domain-containing protein [Candidatus Dojkabacteria bacterium]|uniref:DUF1653 domain-containing protein n=1 Tax=Candidatus Dojkabacteria bacterium TaxID=2099670 RepID=A0A955I995_9BACT|nr:DUF1653 domain-containing protein [Candidatus Dojkabacteria bacterium]